MRRETRKHEGTNTNKSKSIFYIGGSILGIGIIVFVLTFILYGNSMEKQSEVGNGKIAELMKSSAVNVVDTKEASTQIGKTVEESKNEISNTTNSTKNSNNTIEINKNTTKKENTDTKKQNVVNTSNAVIESSNKEQENKETKKEELQFTKPVEGEISRAYAKENLVYSETLQEWTTHLGIDIKAEKTTIVKAAEAGKIKSIKNDPRYGLSIIIEHQEGYETLYSNLLTSEFVEVGEEVKKGQSIGTVGDTATFEIIDDPHLHFEISKDGENIDPTGLIK